MAPAVASQDAGEVDPQLGALTLLRAVGDLFILGPGYGRASSAGIGCSSSAAARLAHSWTWWR